MKNNILFRTSEIINVDDECCWDEEEEDEDPDNLSAFNDTMSASQPYISAKIVENFERFNQEDMSRRCKLTGCHDARINRKIASAEVAAKEATAKAMAAAETKASAVEKEAAEAKLAAEAAVYKLEMALKDMIEKDKIILKLESQVSKMKNSQGNSYKR